MVGGRWVFISGRGGAGGGCRAFAGSIRVKEVARNNVTPPPRSRITSSHL